MFYQNFVSNINESAIPKTQEAMTKVQSRRLTPAMPTRIPVTVKNIPTITN